MPGRFKLTEAAERDLEGIHRYTVEEHGRDQAAKYLGGLRAKLELLAEMPAISPRTERESPVRMGLYEKHRILYRQTSFGIEVGRILHHAQDHTRILERYTRRARREEKQSPKRL